jgi:hypothetical protein
MKATHALVAHVLGHVLAQVSRHAPRLLQHAGANWQVAYQLDVHDPAPPEVANQALAHVPTDSEVDVQAMPARMPLRHPEVRQGLAAKLAPQTLEELGNVRAQLRVVEATLARIRERRQPVEPIRRQVPTYLRARPAPGLLFGALNIGCLAADRRTPEGWLEAATALGGIRVERECPASL